MPDKQNTIVNTTYTICDKLQLLLAIFTIIAYCTYSTNNCPTCNTYSRSTLPTIVTIPVLITVLIIFGMFTILKNEAQNDYGVYEKIQRYNLKSPDTLYIYTRKVN